MTGRGKHAGVIALAMLAAGCTERALGPFTGASADGIPRATLTTVTSAQRVGGEGADLGHFQYPYNLTTDRAGNLYVADAGNHRVVKLDASGSPLAAWGSQGSAPGQFERPMDVAVDATGNVYVADTYNDRVQKLSPRGEVLAVWSGPGGEAGGFKAPHGLAVAANGNVYIADALNHRVVEVTSGGTLVRAWGGQGSEPGQFRYPHDVAVDASGNVYVTDFGNHRIQKFNAEGTFASAWGQKGTETGQFQYPWGIAVDNDGFVWVGDLKNHRIATFTSSGAPVASLHDLPVFRVQQAGMINLALLYHWFGGGGSYAFTEQQFVAYADGGVYDVASAEHGNLEHQDSYSAEPGNSLDHPKGIAFGANGTVWVTEPGTHSLVRLK